MADVIVKIAQQRVRVSLRGAQGPRGLPSGPLADNTVEAVHLSDDSGEQAAMLAKIGAASGAVFVKSGTDNKTVTSTSTGIGIDLATPSALLHLGSGGYANASNSALIVGRAVTGASASFYHCFSDSCAINVALTGGDTEQAYNSYDARVSFSGAYNYNHYAGFQSAPTFGTSGTVRDYWAYVASGTVTAGALTRYKAFFAANVIGNVGTEIGFYSADLTAGLTDNFGIYIDGTVKSRVNKLGIAYDTPSQMLDVNAPTGDVAITFRRAGSAGAFFGLPNSADSIMTGSTAGDFIIRIASNDFAVTCDGGVSAAIKANSSNAVFLPGIGTTANAANAYIDNAATNSILRSTSTREGKADFEDMTEGRALEIVQALRPKWFSSLSVHDRAEQRHLGLFAEDVAAIEPALAHWTKADNDNLVPSGVQYERVSIALVGVAQNHERRLRAVEAHLGLAA